MLFYEMGMEFKDKNMLYCFSEVKCKQGSYNALGLTVSMYISDLMVIKSELRYSDLGSFPGTGDYEFTFQFF